MTAVSDKTNRVKWVTSFTSNELLNNSVRIHSPRNRNVVNFTTETYVDCGN